MILQFELYKINSYLHETGNYYLFIKQPLFPKALL